MVETWLVKFQREVRESIGTIRYFELRICGSGQLGLKNQL